MVKTLKTFIIFLSCFLILTSCDNDNTVSNILKNGNPPSLSNETTAPSASGDGSENIQSTSIKSLSDLFNSEHTLKIQKSGDSKYHDASTLLTYVIADLLSKATEIDPASSGASELIKGYDMQKYDYRLQFTGAKDILVSTKDNMVHFDGEKALYGFWGDTSKLWENIKIDSQSDAMDLNDKGFETMVKSYKEDLGDGKKTDIDLVYRAGTNSDFKGDLLLRIGDKDVTVFDDLPWQIRPVSTMNTPPQIDLLTQKSKKNRLIIVSFTCLTSGYGQTGEIFAYNYKNGNIESVDLLAPETNFKYSQGNTYTAEFPEINSSQNVKFDADEYKKHLDKNTTLKDLLSNKDVFYNQPFSFLIKDYNGDGVKELCSMSSLTFETTINMSMGIQYTYYTCDNDKIKPLKIIIAPPFDEKDKSALSERDILEAMFDHGKITFGDGGIEDSWYVQSEDYAKNQVIDTVNKLLSSKQFKKQGKNIFVNF